MAAPTSCERKPAYRYLGLTLPLFPAVRFDGPSG